MDNLNQVPKIIQYQIDTFKHLRKLFGGIIFMIADNKATIVPAHSVIFKTLKSDNDNGNIVSARRAMAQHLSLGDDFETWPIDLIDYLILYEKRHGTEKLHAAIRKMNGNG